MIFVFDGLYLLFVLILRFSNFLMSTFDDLEHFLAIMHQLTHFLFPVVRLVITKRAQFLQLPDQ
jgi:hypothetical protein